MNTNKEFSSYINGQKAFLEEIIGRAKLDIQTAPKGVIHCKKSHNANQYSYHKSKKDRKGVYVKKSNYELVARILQRDFASKFLTETEKQYALLNHFLQNYNLDILNNSYLNLPDIKRTLISPYLLDDDSFAKIWRANKIAKLSKSFIDSRKFPISDELSLCTECGESVRSKSEKIIADKLFSLEIPYLYEYPLKLSGYKSFHPDFTVLNKRTRQEFILEHFGMFDDTEYCNKALQKLDIYAKHDIIQGKNLLITYETSMHPINIRSLESLIREYLL